MVVSLRDSVTFLNFFRTKNECVSDEYIDKVSLFSGKNTIGIRIFSPAVTTHTSVVLGLLVRLCRATWGDDELNDEDDQERTRQQINYPARSCGSRWLLIMRVGRRPSDELLSGGDLSTKRERDIRYCR